jgi:TRAP-type C4-dicarboxylate transport system substrate-binding protein
MTNNTPALAMLGAACALGVMLAAPQTMAETFRLRVGSGHPASGVSHMEALDKYFLPQVAARVAAQTDHEITWTTAYAGTLAKLSETLNATKTGLIDIGVVNYAFHPSELYTHTFPFYLPFNTGDAVQATQAMRVTYNRVPWLENVFEEKFNQKLLGLGANGNYGVGTTFPFEKYADLDGSRISAAGPNLELFRNGNVTPVNSPAPEAYNAIKSGVYEGAVLFAGMFQSLKLGEVAPHFTKVDIGSPSALSININLKTWNKLPPDVQKIFADVGREYEYVSAVAANAADAKGLMLMKEEGVKVHEFPFEEKAAWAENLADLPNEKAKEGDARGEPASEVVRTYIQSLKELGYVWPQEYEIK